MRMLFILLLLVSSQFAIIREGTATDILNSARNADIQAYFYFSGVRVDDTPKITPYFACVRAYTYRNFNVNGSFLVDRIGCMQNSFYKQAWQGINMCNAGNKTMGKRYIDGSLGYPVKYEC